MLTLRGVKPLDMSWEEPGMELEFARTIAGPWLPVDSGAANSFRLTIGGQPQNFYRLRPVPGRQ